MVQLLERDAHADFAQLSHPATRRRRYQIDAPADAAPAAAPAAAPDVPPTPPPPPPDAAPIRTTGRVIDKLGKPIRGATVTVSGTDVTATTDRRGRFVIKAPLEAELSVEKTGFELQLAIVSGASLDDIVLLGSEDLSETIEVKADAPVPTAGAAQLDRQDLQRVPGTGGDVVRTLTVMPGVVNLQLPIGYSGVVIRGSSPQDSQDPRRRLRDPGAVSQHRVPRDLAGRVDRDARLHPGRLRRRVRASRRRASSR